MAATPSIVELARGYTTDKGWFHQYLEVYDTLLGRHRETARGVLEIGVFQGESLKLWRDAFPFASVLGLDVDPLWHGDGQRIDVVQGDAYTAETLSWVSTARHDVIIDDGPHTLESMLFVARHYSRLLAPGGTLVIEDIEDPAWVPMLAAVLPLELERYAFSIDRRHVPVPSRGYLPDRASILFVVDVTS